MKFICIFMVLNVRGDNYEGMRVGLWCSIFAYFCVCFLENEMGWVGFKKIDNLLSLICLAHDYSLVDIDTFFKIKIVLYN